MSITAYVGLPGHGKSYGVVQYVILPALKNCRQVVTNIPLNLELIAKNFPDSPEPIFIKSVVKNDQTEEDWAAFPKGAVFVIDEIWRLFPAGVKVDKIPEYQKSFLAEHRHMVDVKGRSTDIIFVTQDLSQINTFSRNLIESTFKAVKITKLGTRKSFRVDVYEGAPTGQNIPDKLLIRSTGITKYKEEIYQYYKSHTMSDTDGDVEEVQVDDRTSIFGSGWLKYGVPLALLIIVFGLYSSYNAMQKMSGGGIGKPPKHLGSKKVDSVSPSALGVPSKVLSQSTQYSNSSVVEVVEPVLSQVYRIKGYLGGYVYITNGSFLFRTKDCDIKAALIDIVCTFNGEIVNIYTGSDSTLNAAVNTSMQ